MFKKHKIKRHIKQTLSFETISKFSNKEYTKNLTLLTQRDLVDKSKKTIPL